MGNSQAWTSNKQKEIVLREVTKMQSLYDFIISSLSKDIQTVIVINDRTHYIFHDGDEIEAGWALLYNVDEIVSENSNSVIVKVKYIDED